MAISFKVRVPETGSSLRLTVTGAYYDPVRVTAPETPELTWWSRRPFTLEGTMRSSALLRDKKRTPVLMTPVVIEPKIAPRIAPSATLFTR